MANKEGDPKQLFKQYLKSEGLNITSARQKIAEEIFEIDEHFDATDLWARLHQDTNISMSTIYRTLDLLLEAGLLSEVDLGKAHTHYEHVFGGKEHGHLICLDCGKVEEFTSEKIEEMLDEITEEKGFQRESYKLQVFGFCEDCRD